MNEVGTQLETSLGQPVLVIKAINQVMAHPWWKLWEPPIVSTVITVTGWLAIVWSNQWNNRDLLILQTREVVRNTHLDALYDYGEHLRNAELPSMTVRRKVTSTSMDGKLNPDVSLDSSFSPLWSRL
jgi:hypothetical protein